MRVLISIVPSYTTEDSAVSKTRNQLNPMECGFNKPKERLWQTLEMAGPRSMLSCNLNKLMRDLIWADR